ncbi:hypothetical protein RhiirA4_488201, partial [Rhizophagus irregularis]
DLGYGEAKGSDGLSFEEIQQILSHKLMDRSMPERLLRRVFFHNAIILGLRGGEHSLIKANNFKKRKDGEYDVYIYRSKTNQQGLLNDPFQTGVWYKNSHIGEVRLKGFMREICKLTEINLTNRKITNHGGQKTMIQGLQAAGVPREQNHMNYRTNKNEESNDDTNISKTHSEFDENMSKNGELVLKNKIQVNCGFKTAKEGMLSDKNSLEISIQPEQLLSLIQSGALSNFNVNINVASNN